MELAFVLVKSEIGHEMEVLQNILKIDGVKEVMGTYGQYDIFVKIQVPSRLEIEKIITKKIRGMRNVVSTTTLPVIPEQSGK